MFVTMSAKAWLDQVSDRLVMARARARSLTIRYCEIKNGKVKNSYIITDVLRNATLMHVYQYRLNKYLLLSSIASERILFNQMELHHLSLDSEH